MTGFFFFLFTMYEIYADSQCECLGIFSSAYIYNKLEGKMRNIDKMNKRGRGIKKKSDGEKKKKNYRERISIER